MTFYDICRVARCREGATFLIICHPVLGSMSSASPLLTKEDLLVEMWGGRGPDQLQELVLGSLFLVLRLPVSGPQCCPSLISPCFETDDDFPSLWQPGSGVFLFFLDRSVIFLCSVG